MDFRVGDKVRFVDSDYSLKGSEGIITKINDGFIWFGEPESGGWLPCRFEKVTSPNARFTIMDDSDPFSMGDVLAESNDLEDAKKLATSFAPAYRKVTVFKAVAEVETKIETTVTELA